MVEYGDLTEPQRAALAAIIAGKLAWSPLAVLNAAGHGDAIRELIALELVVMWDRPHIGHLSEDRVTLHPYGAALMQVHILERRATEDPYWDELGREPPPLRLPRRHHEIRCPWMEQFADPFGEDPNREPEYLMDAVSGEDIEFFTQLPDGTEVSGIKIKIDPRLAKKKGKGKGKGKAKGAGKAKRRRAG